MTLFLLALAAVNSLPSDAGRQPRAATCVTQQVHTPAGKLVHNAPVVGGGGAPAQREAREVEPPRTSDARIRSAS